MSEPPSVPVCPRHPERVSYVRCQRCERPVCPDCQVPAAVGVHCVDCRALDQRNRSAHLKAVQSRATPYLTYGFAVVLGLMYVAQLASGAVTRELQFVPALGWQEPWRLLTNALVHDPTFPLHLISNVFMLVLLGRSLEPVLGHAWMAGVCLVSALGGTAGVLWTTRPPVGVMHDDLGWVTGTVGSSTIVYGLLTALVVVAIRHRGDARGLLTLLALNLVFSFVVPNISWAGHIGGGFAGAIVTWALLAAGPGRGRRALAFAVVLLAVTAACVLRYAQVTPYWGGFAS